MAIKLGITMKIVVELGETNGDCDGSWFESDIIYKNKQKVAMMLVTGDRSVICC